jgi:hypothetical protein
VSDHPGAPVGSETGAMESGAIESGAMESGAVAGIALRPEVDPVVMAVLAAAVDQAWPRPRLAPAEEPSRPPVWRFSGRWWSRPAPTRRVRPWA